LFGFGWLYLVLPGLVLKRDKYSMIKHVVLLNWKEGTAAEDVAAVDVAFAGLREQIPQIVSYEFGADAGFYRGNADYALVAAFASEEDLRTYVTHPGHLALLKEVTGPILESFQSAQFEC
jgi:Stress responsive A/B Barrel Domain